MTPEEKEQIEKEDLALPYTENLEKHLQFIRERISELRLQEGLSERALSLDIGKGTSYIQQVTNGIMKPTLVPLFQLCERFHVEPAEFFDPDFHNPTLLHEAMEALKGLDEEDLIQMTVLMRKLGRQG